MRRLRWPALLLAAAAVIAQAPAPVDPVVAQSGGLTITASQVKRLVDGLDPDSRQQLQQDPSALPRLVRAQLLQMIVLEDARAKKYDQNPDVIAKADAARDGVIANAYLASQTLPPADYPSDADIAAAYEANKTRFMLPRQFQLAQIFVPDPTGAPKAADDEAQRKLKDIRALLAKPKADFAAIARQHSEDPTSAANGGDLGWTREDQLLPAIKDVVAGLQDNAVSEPVRAADGWHIVKLLGTRPAGPAAMADVRDQLVRALRQQRQAQAERSLVDEMLRHRPIQLDEIQLQRMLPK